MALLQDFRDEAGVVDIPLEGKRFIIGRDPECVDYVLTEPAVSRIHAIILQQGDDHVIRDMDSKGGTFVNRKRISEATLKDGDSIQIGSTVLGFRLHPEEEEMEDEEDPSASLLLAKRFRRLPPGIGLNCRVLHISPHEIFSPGDTIVVGEGGLRIDNPFPEELGNVILELEFIWPGGRKKTFLGEVLHYHRNCPCIKLHVIAQAEFNRILGDVRRGSWVSVCKAAL